MSRHVVIGPTFTTSAQTDPKLLKNLRQIPNLFHLKTIHVGTDKFNTNSQTHIEHERVLPYCHQENIKSRQECNW